MFNGHLEVIIRTSSVGSLQLVASGRWTVSKLSKHVSSATLKGISKAMRVFKLVVHFD